MDTTIDEYNARQEAPWREICELLTRDIESGLPAATERKIWHGSPVWFIEGNPVAGYAVRKGSVQLLFWSGQSFNEPGLQPEGSFKAAELRIKTLEEISREDVARWLVKAEAIQWDYKNIVKNRGVLNPIKGV